MKFAFELTDEDKATFLDLIYAGLKSKEAAAYLDTTGTQFRKFKRKGGVHYDADFAEKWREAEASEEHRFNREEELRAEVDARSKTSDQILIKRMMAELPEYEVLRHTNFRHDITVTLAERLTGLSADELQQLRALVAKGEPEVVEGALKLLPPAASE